MSEANLPPPPVPPPSTEGDDHKLGSTLVREGLLTPAQLDEALAAQKTMLREGVSIRLGEVLVKKGVLRSEQVRDGLALLGKDILQCATCKATYNVRNWDPSRSATCTQCGRPLVSPRWVGTLDARSTQILPPMRPVTEIHDQLGKPFGRYRLVEELGHGAMGVVWKAWDRDLKRIVALKQPLHLGEDPRGVERFVKEARSSARLRHPQIVAVYDVGTHEGQHFYTTEYVAGISLDKKVAASPLPLPTALEIVRDVAEALDYAHRQGVIHRDVKPSNILVDTEGRPFIMDFGLAKQMFDLRGMRQIAERSTREGTVVGTPAYMSPEQASGETSLHGPASDQFSLGVVLYELICGDLPFQGRTIGQILRSINECTPLPPTARNPRIPADLETVCMRMLRKDPTKRYATLADVARNLQHVVDGEPIEGTPVSGIHPAVKPAGSRKALVTAIFLAVAVCLAIFGVTMSRSLHRKGLVEGLLDVAREYRRQGKASEAADAYARVLKHDEEHAEALGGMEWAQGILGAESGRDERR